METELQELREQIHKTKRELTQIMITQAQFDTDLAAFVAAFTNLVTAIDAYIASKPAADLTAEDTSIQTAAATAATELAKLTPQPTTPKPVA